MIDLAGLNIPTEKAYLFQTRLKPLMLSSGLTMEQIYEVAATTPDSSIALQVIELMTTHETSFFRDSKPFKLFHDLLSEYMKTRRYSAQRLITVYSAGCSTGEEPYSIAMILAEVMKDHPSFKFYIQACDIAEPTLERARLGYYVDVERHVPPDYLEKYFVREGKGWRIVDKLRHWVRFEQQNLLKLDHFREQFDFIFCRNVAIYFEREVRIRLFEKLARRLKPGGCLLTGASESLSSVKSLQRQEGKHGFYYTSKMDS